MFFLYRYPKLSKSPKKRQMDPGKDDTAKKEVTAEMTSEASEKTKPVW